MIMILLIYIMFVDVPESVTGDMQDDTVMIEEVIFDLDGTLLNTVASIAKCCNDTLAEFGYEPFAEDRYKYFAGDGARNLVKRALIASGDTDLTHFEEAFVRYDERFKEGCMYKVTPYEGIPELIAELKRRGIKLAVLSNKQHDRTVSMIRHFFGEDTFDVILGQMDGVPIKPDPKAIELIMDKTSVTLREVLLYVGDTATDMKTGHNAGLRTVGVLWGFRTREELESNGADHIIE